jgi:hypothetical protein
MKTQSLIGTRFPCPHERSAIADRMKKQTLSLTPRFSEVDQLLAEHINGFNRLLAWSRLQKLPFSKHFKAFQRKYFSRRHAPAAPSGPTQSNQIQPYPSPPMTAIRVNPTISDQIRLTFIDPAYLRRAVKKNLHL